MLPFTRPWIDEDTIEAVAEVLRSGWLASGPKVAQLEAELSSYFGGRPVRTQTSATAGLEMALLACRPPRRRAWRWRCSPVASARAMRSSRRR